MEGDVEIDDDTLLKIGQLMQLVDFTKKQNYVRLNDTDFAGSELERTANSNFG